MIMKLTGDSSVVKSESGLTSISAPGKTDAFIDMLTGKSILNAPFYYTEHSGDFIMRVSIEPGFRSTYDAGALFVYESDRKWIKLAFENTDLGYPSVVSVVTNRVSDDANGEKIDAPVIRLQVVRKKNAWCLHYSCENERWKMVRYFELAMKSGIRIGMLAQSPVGDGCNVRFRHFEVIENNYSDIRKAESV
jgi:uncharacterized protein